jgi:hypothetical protein
VDTPNSLQEVVDMQKRAEHKALGLCLMMLPGKHCRALVQTLATHCHLVPEENRSSKLEVTEALAEDDSEGFAQRSDQDLRRAALASLLMFVLADQAWER